MKKVTKPEMNIDAHSSGHQFDMPNANAVQVGGTHYKKLGNIQPWDMYWHWNLNAFQASILKYVVRYRDKEGVQDLEKARHYIDKLIELEKQK